MISMSNVVPFSARSEAAKRVEAGYVSAWSDYYGACRSQHDRETAIRLADSHVRYLQRRDAEVLADVAEAMKEPA